MNSRKTSPYARNLAEIRCRGTRAFCESRAASNVMDIRVSGGPSPKVRFFHRYPSPDGRLVASLCQPPAFSKHLESKQVFADFGLCDSFVWNLAPRCGVTARITTRNRKGQTKCVSGHFSSPSRRPAPWRPVRAPISNAAPSARPVARSRQRPRAAMRLPARFSAARRAWSATTSRRSSAKTTNPDTGAPRAVSSHRQRHPEPSFGVAFFMPEPRHMTGDDTRGRTCSTRF